MNRSWLSRHPAEVAFDLIGCHLSTTRDGVTSSGRIVEVEAYAGMDDHASHSASRQRARQVMSGQPGTIYVYLSYGIHTCMNIVAHEPNQTGGILIRAIEPTIGIDIMRSRRGSVPDIQMGRGPGNVGQALGVLLTDLGDDLFHGDVFQLTQGSPPNEVWCGPRVGISKAIDHPWRFFDRRSRAVSAHRRGQVTAVEDVRADILLHSDSVD